MNLFIDTNVLLSFYHLTSDDLEELRKLSALISRGEIKLIIPKQVIDEYRRNRENKIEDSLKRLKDQKLIPQFPQICKDYPEYAELRKQQGKYSKTHAELMQKLAKDIKSHNLKADIIIEDLFQKATHSECTADIVEKAKLGVTTGNPPGKNGSFGDSINWETLLESVADETDLHFVADDKDYYSILDNDAFNEFLLEEWKRTKSSELFCYHRLSTFFKEHFPSIKLASEVEKELLIKEFSESRSFQSTHTAVSKLSKYTDFTLVQVDQILDATLKNNQIRWIITDDDVKEFLSSIIDGKEEQLNKDNITKIKERLRDEEEVQDESNAVDDVPF